MSKYDSLKAIMVVVIATGTGRILGFIREMIIAANFGTTSENDALIIALTMPDIILGIISAALTTILIPVYIEAREKKGRAAGIIFISSLLLVVILLTLILSVMAYMFASPIINCLAPGFLPETKLLATELFIIFIPVMVITSIITIFSGFLQANLNFFIPAFISIPLNIFVISFAYFLSGSIGVSVIAWGYVTGSVFQLAIIFIYANKHGFKISLNFSDSHKYLKSAWTMLVPVLIGSSVAQFNIIICNYLASGLSAGSIASLYYADKLILFPHSVFIMALAIVAFPSFSKNIAVNDKKEFNLAIVKWMNILLMFVIPLTVGFIILRNPIVQIVYQHGRFNYESTMMTATIVQFYALALPAYGLRELFNKIFYSLKETVIPMKIGMFSVSINILLNILLVKEMQYCGLALATTLSSYVSIILLFYKLVKKGHMPLERHHLINMFKFIFAAVVMGLIVKVFYGLAVTHAALSISLLLSILIGIITYFTSIAILSPKLIKLQTVKIITKLGA